MALVEMVMPKMGESVMEGTILEWLKQEGDLIEQDESVLEVATDKVDTEVPATDAGTLVSILAQEGDVVQVGSVIAMIETGVAATSSPSDAPTQVEVSANTSQNIEPVLVQNTAISFEQSNRFYSPLVKNIAKEEGVSLQELEQIQGSGKENRVTKSDILAHLQNRTTQTTTAPVPASTPQQPVKQVAKTARPAVQQTSSVSASVSGNVEIVQMDRMRKMIAKRMVDSVQTAPHVTSFVEADVTNLFKWRSKWKRVLKERDGTALTFTPIFIQAIARALQDFPLVNSSIDGDNIIIKKDINVGMAVALPSGNLIVPVIKAANQLNLLGLTHKVNDFARRARENKLKPDDLEGGTYTMSNIGTFGNLLGTPIIMQPQSAILSIGAIVKKPAVLTTDDGDVIAIRQKMFLSHSYDHRIIDGALGGQFVRRVADYLEDFDVNMSI
jgi:2-oxoglutarate dehydrogenase E2 component (dihydrolipoamide succinyltransferase)